MCIFHFTGVRKVRILTIINKTCTRLQQINYRLKDYTLLTRTSIGVEAYTYIYICIYLQSFGHILNSFTLHVHIRKNKTRIELVFKFHFPVEFVM